jgi:hypothetical protein
MNGGKTKHPHKDRGKCGETGTNPARAGQPRLPAGFDFRIGQI